MNTIEKSKAVLEWLDKILESKYPKSIIVIIYWSVIMSLYEILVDIRDLVSPWITRFESHGLMILIIAIISVKAIFEVLKNQKKVYQKLLEENQKRSLMEEELVEINSLNASLVQTIPLLMDIIDEEGNIIFMNPVMEKSVGKNQLGNKCWDVYKDDKQKCEECPIDQPIDAELSKSVEKDHLMGDRVYEITRTKMVYKGKPAILRFFYDVTSRKQTENVLSQDVDHYRGVAQSRELAASVFTHAREGITITDADGNILDVNKTFFNITGYNREDVIGKNPRILKSGKHGLEFYEDMWKTITDQGFWSGEIWNRRKNGEEYAAMLTISAIRDAEDKTQNYVALFSDITPIKRYQNQLEHIAHYDTLTGLPNRVLLADRLQQAKNQSDRRKQSLAVAYLDLDGFKTVNDTHGHDVGDELLIAISKRMKDVLRDGDTIARIGGDEFVAILVDLEKPEDCEPVLKRLLKVTSEPVIVREHKLNISASIGVTIYPQDESDVDKLVRHADHTMYQAKQAGKNRFSMFDVDHDVAVQIEHDSLERIYQAFNNNEFVLYYQPKVNMKTGVVIGAEALIRWQNPEKGLLPPASFLPIIEDHPISVKLGDWVIDTALRQMSKWQTMGLVIPTSVNVSAYQLHSDGFVMNLSQLLNIHSDIEPGWLELEILETSALRDMVKVSDVMHECRKIGVHFALDDFGTGYSSLTYLKHLPVDVLKIDQSFVRDIMNNQDSLAIIKGVMGLAIAFDHQVIAEGVETAAHGVLLLPLGCELAQGYGIARPMPAEEFPDWIKKWKPSPSWICRT